METTSFCLLLALCAALSGVDGQTSSRPGPTSSRQPPVTTPPAALVKKCCRLRYQKLISVLFQRPSNDDFNAFLKRFLKYTWLYKRYARLRVRFWRHRGLMRRIMKKVRAMYRALYKTSRRWIRSRPLKKLGRKAVQGGQSLHRFLRRRWALVLKKNPVYYEEPLREFCRESQDTARSACPGFDLGNCGWFQDCSALLPPQSNQATTASPASTPTAGPRSTRSPSSRSPSTGPRSTRSRSPTPGPTPAPATTSTTPPTTTLTTTSTTDPTTPPCPVFLVNGEKKRVCERILRCTTRKRQRTVTCLNKPNGPVLSGCRFLDFGFGSVYRCIKKKRLKKFMSEPGCYWGAVGSGTVPLLAICPVRS